ncbi:MAG: hypothetical protein ABIP61_07470 [Burkholderiaceae bacterium]
MTPIAKDPIRSTTPLADQATRLADQAAESADHAIRATQQMSERGFDHLAHQVDNLHDRATPLLNRLTGQAEAAARRGVGAMRDASHQVRERAARVSDNTAGYVRDEPMKSMLIAAAAGAALMAVVGFLTRSGGRD